MSLEIYLRGEGSTSSLSRWRERQATRQGNGGLKDAYLRRIHAGLDPTVSGPLCLFAQILAHSLVDFRALPLAPLDPLVMARLWVRLRASEQAELWVEKG